MKVYFALNFYISIKLAFENQFINLRSKLVYSALQNWYIQPCRLMHSPRYRDLMMNISNVG